MVQVGLIIALAFMCLLLYAQLKLWQGEAFKWRKRWIIERFGIGVEGQEGDYFILGAYSSGVPYLHFSKNKKHLNREGIRIRHWNHHIGRDYFSENCDMPDEVALGLPKNIERDDRRWIAAGPGLCLLPPALHEKALAAKEKKPQ